MRTIEILRMKAIMTLNKDNEIGLTIVKMEEKKVLRAPSVLIKKKRCENYEDKRKKRCEKV